jgi:hypothetical protein
MLRIALMATVVVVAACHAPIRGPGLAPPPSALGRREIIQVDEIRRHDDMSTLLDVLRRVRPQMLRPRFGATGQLPMESAIDVFIDGHYMGGAEVLRQIAPSHVFSVRMMQRAEGYVQYGGQLRGSHALFVTLRR